MIMAKRLEDKTALITGGASGIGATTALLFLQHGAKVVIADIQDNLGQAFINDIGPNKNISFIHCDVSNEYDVKNAVDDVITKHGKLDIMFAHAGGAGGKHTTTILDDDSDILKNAFNVNVFGSFYCGKHAARVMIPVKTGTIIFTASAGAVCFGLGPHPYIMSKAAVIGFAKNLGVELGQHGIRVNCISPYAVTASDQTHRMSVLGVDKVKARAAFLEAANLKGVDLDEDDVANAALYFASNESKYTSGQNLVLDGGYCTTNRALSIAFKKAKM